MKTICLALLLSLSSIANAYECTTPDCPQECLNGQYYTNGVTGPGAYEFCTINNISLPTGATADCASVAGMVGWIGYRFPLASNPLYVCSVGFYGAANDGVTGLCYMPVWPPQQNPEAYCNHFGEVRPGYVEGLGYYWKGQ